MTLKIADRLHGFVVDNIRESAELRGNMVEMHYEKTGTRLCWIDNKEENKLFSITFKTLPENSTGVFHILEHSTLCGSKKYPVREPFVELLKSSMNTFLNAMTFPDKTMYPVSSRVDKDYLNLAGVYMDAVFAPRLLTDPNIFYQEGRHIEVDEEGNFTYKGVVFNEMKGAMSSADRLMGERLEQLLYRGSSYGFNSGGDPEEIPDLTYEKFVETYKRFYHPSNAYVFLDGDVPLEETLAMLDEYFSQFEKSENLPVVTPAAGEACEDSICFEVNAEEDLTDKSRLCIGKIVADWTEKEKLLAISVINDVLCGSNESPLKRAVLSSGLAQDMDLSIDDSVFQPMLELDLVNIKDGKEEELLNLIRETLKDIIGKGLDRDALEAGINRMEFRSREPEEPQGLIRCITAFSGWLHGGDPMKYCTWDKDFAAVRGWLQDGTFDRLAKEIYLDESGLAVLHGIPSHTISDEKREKEAARLQAIKEGMTAEEIDALKKENAALEAWQKTPDSPEALATLPLLSISDVDPAPKLIKSIESIESGVKTVFHPVSCHGIHYIRFFYDLTDYSLEELQLLSLVCGFFTKLPTEKTNALLLEQKVKNSFGRLSFDIRSFSKGLDRGSCTPKLMVSCSVLDDKLDDALELLHEIMMTTDFSVYDRIREIIMQIEEESKQIAARGGHMLGITAAGSHFSSANAVTEMLSGYSSIQLIHSMAKDFDAYKERIAAISEKCVKETFVRSRLVVTVSGDTACDVSALTDKLPVGTPVPEKTVYSVDLPNPLGLCGTTQVSFAERSWNLDEMGLKFDGSMYVGANIISLCYLWNRVRVQGGAYGCGLRVTPAGGLDCYSYRDPSPDKTLTAYDEMGDFLRSLAGSDEDIEKYIISTVSGTDPLASPRDYGNMADTKYFNGVSYEEEKNNRTRMLSTTKEDLARFADVLDEFAKKGAVCVVGHAAALKECGNLTVLDI